MLRAPVVPHLVGRQIGGAPEGTTAIRLHHAVLVRRADRTQIGQPDRAAGVRTGEQMYKVSSDTRVVPAVPVGPQLVESRLDAVGALGIVV